MIRATAAATLALALALALAGCANTSQSRDVVAVVQDEQSRQAVAQTLNDGKSADAALARAAEASDVKTEAPR